MVTRIAYNIIMNLHILLMFLILHSVPFLRLPDIPSALKAPHACAWCDMTHREWGVCILNVSLCNKISSFYLYEMSKNMSFNGFGVIHKYIYKRCIA